LGAGGARDAERALDAALELGIRFFDTADSYAQGDSERLLGRVLKRAGDRALVATKAGYVLPAPRWALRFAKPPLRLLARASRRIGGSLREWRDRGLAQRFDPAHLGAALRGSLRRLQRERIDLFLLHDPPADLASADALWRWVEAEQRAGHLRGFGVSCAGTAADIAWLHAPAVEVVQVGWRLPAGAAGDPFLAAARRRGVGIIAREFLGERRDDDAIRAGLRGVLAHPEVSVALVGMSRPDHVRANARLAQEVAADTMRAHEARMCSARREPGPNQNRPARESGHPESLGTTLMALDSRFRGNDGNRKAPQIESITP
jgi:aryl-alcohol dehydrogenase-like predicted oxidoreductase